MEWIILLKYNGCPIEWWTGNGDEWSDKMTDAFRFDSREETEQILRIHPDLQKPYVKTEPYIMS